ncbi:ATP-binding protein [Sphingomonas sp. TX0522]|uniref:ATP-binding protein n=1 Tax=Sphingomonas sp. TX0522 TaxID=2479205 RepID=UPI0018DFC5BC|nr:ATP-binding protein [Sphingomonas sp. TX0522]MBI0533024.1 ATP-binding protein [Sphingomonas sp. TX0522]
MHLPSTIRATVSPTIITKVGRLFNGTVDDVFAELLQNARRAGASQVEIATLDLAGQSVLAIGDNGRGIDDPSALLRLGQSEWTDTIAAREDPAGMGFFSLAGQRVEVRSFSAAAGAGWRLTIEPDAWQSGAAIAVEPFDITAGTEILIDTPEAWDDRIAAAVAEAARFYPVPVGFNGEPQVQEDWLAKAVYVEEWNGSRIGVFRDNPRGRDSRSINFHGLTVACRLPEVSEVGRGGAWRVLVDIGNTPGLHLVLPARKEVVQTTGLEETRVACRRAIYRAIAREPRHRLAFAEWEQARALGVELAAAAPYLFGWQAPSNDSSMAGLMGEAVSDVPMIVMPDLSPDIGQSASRALRQGKPLGARLVFEESAFEGYGWYDALPVIDDVAFLVDVDGEHHRYSETAQFTGPGKSGPVDAITCEVTVPKLGGSPFQLPADLLVADPHGFSQLDEVAVLFTDPTSIAVDDLVDLLEAAVFSDSDDSDADSYQTQQADFRRDARDFARRLLCGDDEALLEKIREAVDRYAAWSIPEGRRIVITLTAGSAEVMFDDPPEGATSAAA